MKNSNKKPKAVLFKKYKYKKNRPPFIYPVRNSISNGARLLIAFLNAKLLK